MNVLFVCSRNQWRSPTAEQVFRRRPGLIVRSAGTSRNARKPLSAALLQWADVVCVMEEAHKSQIVATFRQQAGRKTIYVLDIPDDYRYMDEELVALLQESVPPLLGLS